MTSANGRQSLRTTRSPVLPPPSSRLCRDDTPRPRPRALSICRRATLSVPLSCSASRPVSLVSVAPFNSPHPKMGGVYIAESLGAVLRFSLLLFSSLDISFNLVTSGIAFDQMPSPGVSADLSAGCLRVETGVRGH